MQNQASTEKKDKGVWDLIADIILVVYILLIFFSNALFFLGPILFDEWFYGPTKYVQGFFWILSHLSLILVGVAIKNIYIKIFGILIALIVALYNAYRDIEWILYDPMF